LRRRHRMDFLLRSKFVYIFMEGQCHTLFRIPTTVFQKHSKRLNCAILFKIEDQQTAPSEMRIVICFASSLVLISVIIILYNDDTGVYLRGHGDGNSSEETTSSGSAHSSQSSSLVFRRRIAITNDDDGGDFDYDDKDATDDRSLFEVDDVVKDLKDEFDVLDNEDDGIDDDGDANNLFDGDINLDDDDDKLEFSDDDTFIPTDDEVDNDNEVVVAKSDPDGDHFKSDTDGDEIDRIEMSMPIMITFTITFTMTCMMIMDICDSLNDDEYDDDYSESIKSAV